MDFTPRHWHIGSNRVGYLPDDPESVWVAHTAQDALIGLLGELNVEAEALADFDEEGKVDDAISDLEDCLPFFNENGAPNLDAATGTTVKRHLIDLDGTLSFRVDDRSFWAQSCVNPCADAV